MKNYSKLAKEAQINNPPFFFATLCNKKHKLSNACVFYIKKLRFFYTKSLTIILRLF
nr:MAG TPA: hypothetical protein [Bacteriophage sp.]